MVQWGRPHHPSGHSIYLPERNNTRRNTSYSWMEGEGELSLTVCSTSPQSSQSLARLYKSSLQAILEQYQSRLQASLGTSHSEETSNNSRQIIILIVSETLIYRTGSNMFKIALL